MPKFRAFACLALVACATGDDPANDIDSTDQDLTTELRYTYTEVATVPGGQHAAGLARAETGVPRGANARLAASARVSVSWFARRPLLAISAR